MKKIKLYLLAMVALVATGCTKSFDNLSDATEVAPISMNFNPNFEADDLTGYELTLRLINYDENLEYSFPVTSTKVEATGVIPGIYTAVLSGKGYTDNAEVSEYLMNGSLVNESLTTNGKSYDITVKAGIKGNIIFKELYFSGVPSYYFRDQFYELYNNSNQVVYLDGLHIANLEPSTATTSLPTWEDEKDKYVYGARVWKFPGNGTDYPLQPGESIIVAQHAKNHKESNANSPVDLSSAEFEFYMGSTAFPDMPAINMDHVFYEGKSDIGTIQMWLVSVFGGAYVIFKVPEDETWDPVNVDWAIPVGTSSKTRYAKIPVEYVWDAVELGDNESMVNAKRVPGLLDAGMSWVGNIYCGLSVARYFETDANGNPKTLENGSPLYMDTNNSTDDFERGLTPEMRRNGAKIPSWNTWK
jgi:hypothetical protein